MCLNEKIEGLERLHAVIVSMTERDCSMPGPGPVFFHSLEEMKKAKEEGTEYMEWLSPMAILVIGISGGFCLDPGQINDIEEEDKIWKMIESAASEGKGLSQLLEEVNKLIAEDSSKSTKKNDI